MQLLLAALAAQQGCAAKSLVWAKSDALVQRVKQVRALVCLAAAVRALPCAGGNALRQPLCSSGVCCLDFLLPRIQAAPAQRVGYTVMLAPGTPHEQPLRMAEPEVCAVRLPSSAAAAVTDSSERLPAWQQLQQQQSVQLLALLCARTRRLAATPLRLHACAQVAAVFHGMLDARLLSRLRAANKSVHAWTANAPRHLGRLLDLGVDGLVTNVPGLAAAAVRARTHKCAAAAGAAVELAPPAA